MDDKHSRLNKFEKRRKATKSISILLLIGGILIILLLGIWIFGGDDTEDKASKGEKEEQSSDITINDDSDEEDAGDKVTKGDDASERENEDESSDITVNDDENDKEKEDKENEEKDKENEIKKEEAAPSDGNVSEAYTGEWSAVGTEQEGPHTTNYDSGSQDRIEIQEASAIATGLDENGIITMWVGNGGDQKVVSTVSSADKTKNYRVFLSWKDGEGWQPTKVEKLKQLDY